MMDQQRQESKRLWIGGSSGLARTYFNTYGSCDNGGSDWILLGHEGQAPSWIREDKHLTFYSLDLMELGKVASTNTTNDDKHHHNHHKFVVLEEFAHLHSLRDIQDVVISIRPPLVSNKTFAQAWQDNQYLLLGLKLLLERLLVEHLATNNKSGRRWLHISSVAAIDHLREHVLRSIRATNDPSSMELDNPYDRFKRATEEMILEMGSSSVLKVVNVRLGAIFSDDSRCIQCTALQLQCRIGCYLPYAIDCNSSRNVAHLISILLFQESQQDIVWQPIYYYTRPISMNQGNPVPYGWYLEQYRLAHGITGWSSCWVPVWLVHGLVVFLIHWLAQTCIPRSNLEKNIPTTDGWSVCDDGIGIASTIVTWLTRFHWIMGQILDQVFCLSHVDYLLQVSTKEHSFDLTPIQTDFPQLASVEETILECFRRRRNLLRGGNHSLKEE